MHMIVFTVWHKTRLYLHGGFILVFACGFFYELKNLTWLCVGIFVSDCKWWCVIMCV